MKKNQKVSIILPTYNERYNIRRLIKIILKIVNPKEIIVVDDNSPDGTWKIVNNMSKRHRCVKLVKRVNERGVASAIHRGISEASGDIVVWMDCDFSMPPETIPKLLQTLNDSDIAVGSRYVKGGKDIRGFVRVLASLLINSIARIVLNFGIRDYTSGFVAAKRKVFKKIDFEPKGHGEYCIEFLYKAKKAGFRITEVPYIFTERKRGEPKTSEYIYSIFLYSIWYLLRVLKIRLKY